MFVVVFGCFVVVVVSGPLKICISAVSLALIAIELLMQPECCMCLAFEMPKWQMKNHIST